MKKWRLLLLVALLLIGPAQFAAFADEPTQEGASVTPLRNRDVLNLVTRKIAPETIINLIKSSPCNFDTFPPVMQELQRRGVPDLVLRAMIEAPYGPPADAQQEDTANQPIYHYAEQLKQYNLATSAQGNRSSNIQQRARATRVTNRRRL